MARNPARTVYIGNLDEKVTERVLYEVLVQAGRVVDLYIPCDRETSCPKGYAFAEYETEEIAQYAVRLFSGLVRLYGKPLKFAISGQDKPTSNGKETSNPVMPKLNPVPLPKKHQFVHHSDMPTLHKPAYPMVNGGIIDYCFSNSYPYSHPQAVSVGPVHSNGGFSNGTYDCNTHAFGSVVNARYGDSVLNFAGHGAPMQPMLYPSY